MLYSPLMSIVCKCQVILKDGRMLKTSLQVSSSRKMSFPWKCGEVSFCSIESKSIVRRLRTMMTLYSILQKNKEHGIR